MELERIGDDKKDRRKRERGSKGKAYIRKGESTKGAALQLLPGAPKMMSVSSQLNSKI